MINLPKSLTAADIFKVLPSGKCLRVAKQEAKMKTTLGNLESFLLLNERQVRQFVEIQEIGE